MKISAYAAEVYYSFRLHRIGLLSDFMCYECGNPETEHFLI